MTANPFNTNNDFSMGYGDLGSTKQAPAASGAWSGNAADESEDIALDNTNDSSWNAVPSAGATATVTDKDVKKREKELTKREKELAKREEELRKREQALAAQGAAVAGVIKNWPKCYPIVRQDIATDIPADFKRTVTVGWMTLWGFAVASIVNFIGALLALIIIGSKDGRLPGMFLALIYLVAGVPLAFAMWYRALYKSAMNDRAFGFAWFFLTFLAHMVFCIWSAVGPDILVSQWSHTGVLSTISAFDKKTSVGIVYIVGTTVWCLETLLSLVLLKMVYSRFRGRGADSGTLRQEMVKTLSSRV